MSFLSPIFDDNYRHPLAKQGDPDRRLSGWMRAGIFFGQASLLVAMLVLLPFSLFFMYLELPALGDHSFLFKSNFKTATAAIIEVEYLGRGNHDKIFTYKYQYFIGDEYVGTEMYKETGLVFDSEVTVEYLVVDHNISRIKTFHEDKNTAVFFLLIPPMFFIMGISGIINTFRCTIREILLLKHGTIALAAITDCVSKGRSGYDTHVKFITNDGNSATAIIPTTEGRKRINEYSIIYLPFDTSKAEFCTSFSHSKINMIYNNR